MCNITKNILLGLLTVFPQQVRVFQMHTSFVLLDRILISNSMDVLRPYHVNSLFQVCLTITEMFSPFYLEEKKNY